LIGGSALSATGTTGTNRYRIGSTGDNLDCGKFYIATTTTAAPVITTSTAASHHQRLHSDGRKLGHQPQHKPKDQSKALHSYFAKLMEYPLSEADG
jgi:hypothetical protein